MSTISRQLSFYMQPGCIAPIHPQPLTTLHAGTHLSHAPSSTQQPAAAAAAHLQARPGSRGLGGGSGLALVPRNGALPGQTKEAERAQRQQQHGSHPQQAWTQGRRSWGSRMCWGLEVGWTLAALLVQLKACLTASEDSLQGLLAPARLAQCQALGCRREGDAGSRPWWIKHLISDAGWVASCSFGCAWPLLQSFTVKATARGMEQPASGSQ